MPDELDEIRERLDALERRMDSEAGLRATMDLDQASLTTRLNVQDRMLRGLAVTQSDHTRRLTRLEDGQRRLEDRLVRVEDGLVRVEDRLVRVEDRLVRVEDGLVRVEDGLVRVEDGLVRVEEHQGRLEIVVGQVETGIQTIIGMLDQDR